MAAVGQSAPALPQELSWTIWGTSPPFVLGTQNGSHFGPLNCGTTWMWPLPAPPWTLSSPSNPRWRGVSGDNPWDISSDTPFNVIYWLSMVYHFLQFSTLVWLNSRCNMLFFINVKVPLRSRGLGWPPAPPPIPQVLVSAWWVVGPPLGAADVQWQESSRHCQCQTHLFFLEEALFWFVLSQTHLTGRSVFQNPVSDRISSYTQPYHPLEKSARAKWRW